MTVKDMRNGLDSVLPKLKETGLLEGQKLIDKEAEPLILAQQAQEEAIERMKRTKTIALIVFVFILLALTPAMYYASVN